MNGPEEVPTMFKKPKMSLTESRVWVLSHRSDEPEGVSYELRVRHDCVEDRVSFWSLDRAFREDLQILTVRQWASRLDDIVNNEDVTKEDAEKYLQTVATIASNREQEIYHHLKSYWLSFVLFFEPAITL
jgi:hypothetical protein